MAQRKRYPPNIDPKKWGFLGFFEKQVPLTKKFLYHKKIDPYPLLSFFGIKKFCQEIGEPQIFFPESLGVI